MPQPASLARTRETPMQSDVMAPIVDFLKTSADGRILDVVIPINNTVRPVSNKIEAGALEIARKSGVPVLHLSLEQFESQEDMDQAFRYESEWNRSDDGV